MLNIKSTIFGLVELAACDPCVSAWTSRAFQGMRNESGIRLFTGVPKNEKECTALFHSTQVRPLIGEEFTSSMIQRVDDLLLFKAACSDLKSQFHHGVRMCQAERRTTFYLHRSQKYRIFAVQCNSCKCCCFYEWHSDTTDGDRRLAVRWFGSFFP